MTKLKIIILGGTGVISRAIVREGIARGHEMTVVNRGTRTVDFGGTVETILADRKERGSFSGRRRPRVRYLRRRRRSHGGENGRRAGDPRGLALRARLGVAHRSPRDPAI